MGSQPTGLPQGLGGGKRFGCPYAHWLEQVGRQGHRTRQRKRRSLPQGLSTQALVTALLQPPDLNITLGTVTWGLFFSQKDLRFLWLPKDTKFERHSLAWSSPGKRSGLDYTSLLATMWRVFSLDNNDFLSHCGVLRGPFSKSMRQPLCFLSKGEQK